MEQLMSAIREAVWNHDSKKVKALVEQAVAEQVDINTIVNDGLVSGMNALGAKFKSGEVFMPEILVSARAMGAGMAVIKPLLAQAGIKEKGIFLIGTVKEDLHDIGKNIVNAIFEGSGYKVVDLGINVPSEKFIEAIEEHKPDIVGLCALLTTTMVNMKETTAAIKNKFPGTKIIVGGAPITQNFADEIGADAYAQDAAVAVEKANMLIGA
ncbi:cobalamin B12-binding domain-containing protein [Sporomusa sphaeroides]|uniref:Methionine synthase n=1 Tax=Sporomusa sphaeroides DSM 2875 TaxID=1337886 RepID=A0ABM9W2X0_9FIRM|nr:cobalamin-dependent protein [Sporomusa sphaeroides]OLS55009.1 methionine synthase [Sporomusa sphaeroides DSM 2875]CVK19455.1 Methionine synthase [Sporomusa sphaeroides DSM 2875]